MRGISIDGRTASGERPTHDSWFSPHSGHQRLDRPTWKYSARTSERALPSVRVTESARLRYQENRCSTLHVVRRVTTTCTRLETSNETSHGVAENMHLTHCTQSPPSRLCERVLGSLTIDLFNLLTSSSSYDRCYSTPSSEAQRVIKMYTVKLTRNEVYLHKQVLQSISYLLLHDYSLIFFTRKPIIATTMCWINKM